MKRPSSFISMSSLILASVAVTLSCEREGAVSGTPATATAQAGATPTVAKIVFVGKKNACDCTRTRVDESLAAVREAIEGRSDISIEQLQVDVDEEKVLRYQALRPIMVLPAIYLLEDAGALVDVLQGEVSAVQVRRALGG